MIKKSILLSLILLLSISITTFAVTGMDFLENSSLLETNNYDYKALSIIIKVLTANGQNIDIYRSKLLAAVSKQGVESHAYALLATFNPDMATELTAKQQNGGSWNDDIYLTSLSTYALLATDQQFTNALSGIDYISSNQNEDGGWGVNGQSTPLTTIFAVAALKKANSYNDITQKGLEWLLLHQGGEGGWGNHINTAWACLALHELGTNPDELEKAVNYLKMFINQDGGWGIYPGEASDPFTSATEYLNLYI
jgi:hypothetical protein